MTPAESIRHVGIVLGKYISNPPDESDFRCTGGDYQHPYWDMVRELKDDRYLASLPGCLAVPILQRTLGDLTALAYQSVEEATDDLEALWDKVKMGASEGPLDAAVRRADSLQLKFKTSRLSAIYQRFLKIGYQLQVMRGDEYISLPVDRMGEILGVNPRRVSDYRDFAQHDGFLREVAKYCWSNRGGVATKFRFTCRFVDGVGVSPEVLAAVETEGFDPY